MDAELLIYSPEISPRVEYVFALFFNSLIPTAYRITINKAEYGAYQGPKLNYSSEKGEGDGFSVLPSGLLLQSSIQMQKIEIFEWKGLKMFYRTDNNDLPFDIFSAVFYLVSRYEEYLAPQPDDHARFNATSSIAFQNHFLEQPLVNLWALELKKMLIAKYPGLSFKENRYTYIPTIDIDVAYAHLGRKITVTAGSYLRLLSRFNKELLFEKTAVLLGARNDPYNTYLYQESVFKKYNLSPVYFFLASNRRTRYDRNVDPHKKKFAELVKTINSFASVGIHPSYYSAGNPELVSAEVSNVEQYLPYRIKKSRQHFLRIILPQTYRCLATLNITDDYSLAYAGVLGFRASICTPFLFYDLTAEMTLPVMVHSPAVMDGTLNEYLHLSPGDAEEVVKKLIVQVKKCGGEFISIWHNHSLSEQQHWKGWRTVFERMVAMAAN